jgi:ferredoxin
MRRARTFVVGVLMLWLPLQAITAVSMPFCPHGEMAGLAQAWGHAHHQHGQSTPLSGHDGSRHGNHQPSTGTLQHCNNCGACNLACAPAMPTSAALLSGSAITVHPHFSAHSHGLFIPDQPLPPPNSRL